MKNFIYINFKKILLFSFYYLGHLPFINNKVFTILCYHGFSKSEDKYSIAETDFIKQILRIKKYAKIISIDEFLEKVNSKQINKSFVVLTIDDGYKNVFKISSFINKLDIPAALFVLSKPDNVNRIELNNDSELLTINEIKLLKKQGWTIGCHSATHADLINLNDTELEEEIINSKINLEKKLGFRIDYFAYPKGYYNEKIVKMVKRAGYKAAFTTEAKSSFGVSNLFSIPRVVVENDRGLSDFPAFISAFPLLVRNKIEKIFKI